MRAILLGPLAGSDRRQKGLLRALKIQKNDLLIGVDGGTRIWKTLGYQPNLAVGDWDSLTQKKKVLAGLSHITLPQSKERSDLFYAAVAAIELGAQELVCLGVTGGRMDHHLAMLLDLSGFSTGRYGKLKSVQAIGLDANYYFLSEAIPSWKGVTSLKSIISIFAMNGAAGGVTLSGFRYNLKNAVLNPSSHGLSNQTRRRNCEVSLRKGQLLVIMLRNGIK